MRVSLSGVVAAAFVAYVVHSTWTIYTLFTPPACASRCIQPYVASKPKLTLSLFTSTKRNVHSASDLSPLWHKEDLDIGGSFQVSVNVSVPKQTRNNGSLQAHAILMPVFQRSQSVAHMLSSPYAYHVSAPLTSYLVPVAQTFNLLGSNDTGSATVASTPLSHWRHKLCLNVMGDPVAIPATQVPPEILKHIRLNPHGDYLPILYIDTLSNRVHDFKPIRNDSNSLSLLISYAPISFGKLRFVSQVELAMKTMENFGFSEKDLDEVKGIFMDTNLYLLCLTFLVAALHLLFDFLAFKNDIAFWRHRRNMVGLSTRTLVWRCVSNVVVFLFLLDERSSMLVLVPAAVGSVIEVWKLTKAFRVELAWNGVVPKLKYGKASAEEEKTQEYDAQSMRYLSFVLYPLCVAGAAYNLLYTPHKGWYSWCIHSLVNGVYAFGFLLMLPQLFVNYKHRSVAHLPWKAFTYKAFNTFIDDVFAFVISMPTAHRIACFRDDVVFLLYLYQRWLYPVDRSRVNEFGQSFDDRKKKQ